MLTDKTKKYPYKTIIFLKNDYSSFLTNLSADSYKMSYIDTANTHLYFDVRWLEFVDKIDALAFELIR